MGHQKNSMHHLYALGAFKSGNSQNYGDYIHNKQEYDTNKIQTQLTEKSAPLKKKSKKGTCC